MRGFHLHSKVSLVIAGLFAVTVWAGCGDQPDSVVEPQFGPLSTTLQEQVVGPAIRIQERHTDRLLRIDGVVGTAVGITADGMAVVKIFTTAAGIEGLPKSLDGIPVLVEVTGEFFAFADPTSRFNRPVPIGVSTGNEGSCSAGTIGARVKDGAGSVYALSNNHVYALENAAPIGSDVLQPGRYDTNCNIDPNDVLGQLSDFEPLKFDGSDNTIDAAIAISSTANLGTATPSDGYGTPQSSIIAAFVGQAVQKYGRTTALTHGSVTGINVTVRVGYSSGTARFVNQIIAEPLRGAGFIKAGDSGSLLVVDGGSDDRRPVGLLFAGNRSGSVAIANRIDLVLQRFNVTIDDSPSEATNSSPTASFTFSCTDLACDFDGSGSSDSDGTIQSYAWDFGDGSTGSGETVSHSYGSAGTYTVSLTVTDDDGATDTDSQSQDVSVSEPSGSASVSQIVLKVEKKGPNYSAVAEVYAENGTSVTGDFYLNDVFLNSATQTVGTGGFATLKSAKEKGLSGSDVFKITITSPTSGVLTCSVSVSDGSKTCQ